MELKTPGVYLVEKNAFPNSVVEVATAVPAFVGYTAIASGNGKSLLGQPFGISSMAEYLLYFGGAPQPRFTIRRVAESRDAAALASATIAAIPPAPDTAAARGQTSVFRHGDKTYVLARPAGRTGGRFLMHQAMKHFFENGGGACYVVSVGHFDSEIIAGDATTGLLGGIVPLCKEQEPTLLLVPDAVLLPRADCARVQTAMLEHCGQDMRNRFALLDVWGGDFVDDHGTAGRGVDDFRNDIGNRFLSFAAAYTPWLHTSLAPADALGYRVIDNPADLVVLLKDELERLDATAGGAHLAERMLPTLADVPCDAADDDEAHWLTKLTRDIGAGGGSAEKKQRAKDELADPERRTAAVEARRRQLDQALMQNSELFAAIMAEARTQLDLMPPAAAMAGVYTLVDNAQGVWKAPANVGIADVIRPATLISDAEQGDLNVPLDGKSINAIRSFAGQGVRVWGARTLDGNSLDGRYINVRRTIIMLDASCRLATRAMVFEPNVSNTWVTLRSMIHNFLTSVWKRGGLVGAVPEDAFGVQVGLGETMTAEDIAQGILRVGVRVAVSQPAEFIEFSFEQQMQKA